ncbi:MAG TPA: GNAT family N-acetyltransferase [Puia sp.]|nr:GNAT family N-acetyltransferase [Puia sp.]
MNGISHANTADIPSLINLLNSAYRGEASRKGWTTEADLLKGNQRMDRETMLEHLESPDAVMLKYTNQDGNIDGCVFLQKKQNRMYLGMLSVSPDQQANGIGKQLLSASIDHAKRMDCQVIYMSVISERNELIAWYERHGYHQTGERIPFAPPEKFGIPVSALEFVVLECNLSTTQS